MGNINSLETNDKNKFNELNVDDLLLIDGGIGFLAATVVVLTVLGGTAVVSFAGGAIYKAVLG